MSNREIAHAVIDRFDPVQLEAFLKLFAAPSEYIEEVEPDEWDRKMIEESKTDNNESMSLDDFAKELGIDLNELRV